MEKQQRQYVPSDLHYEILASLPVKSLLRFRCVCKPWCSVISSRAFQLEHHCHRRAQEHLLSRLIFLPKNDTDVESIGGIITDGFIHRLYRYTRNEGGGRGPFERMFSFADLEFGQRKDSHIISYRGMVCIHNDGSNGILICNPLTKDQRVLPRSLHNGDGPICVGIGYVDSTQKYKVVRFSGPLDKPGRCEVFTLGGDNYWREARNPPFAHSRWKTPFLHGAFHLLPRIEFEVLHDYLIAAFNLESEEYSRTIRIPESYSARSRDGLQGLTELGGLLSLIFHTMQKSKVEVWLLKDYNNDGSWEKRYVLDINKFERGFSYPFAMEDYGHQVLLLNLYGDVLFDSEELLYWNNRERKLYDIHDCCSAALYEESLFSP